MTRQSRSIACSVSRSSATGSSRSAPESEGISPNRRNRTHNSPRAWDAAACCRCDTRRKTGRRRSASFPAAKIHSTGRSTRTPGLSCSRFAGPRLRQHRRAKVEPGDPAWATYGAKQIERRSRESDHWRPCESRRGLCRDDPLPSAQGFAAPSRSGPTAASAVTVEPTSRG